MTDQKRKMANIIKTLISSMRLVFQNAKKRDVLFAYLWLVTGVTTSLALILEKNLLNDAAKIVKGTGDTFYTALRWLVAWTVLTLLNKLVKLVSDRATVKMWSDVERNIKDKILAKIARIKYNYFDYTETYKKLEFVKNDLKDKISLIMDAAFQVVFDTIQLVTVSFIIIGENKLIALVIIAGAVPSIIFNHIQTEKSYYSEQENSHETRYQTYVSWVLFKLRFLKEMRFGNLYDHMNDKFDKSSAVLYEKRMSIMRKYTVYKSAANILNWIAVAVSLIWVSWDIVNGRSDIGSFLLIYKAVQGMQDNLYNLFSNIILIGDEGRFIEDYYDVMRFEEEDCGSPADSSGNIHLTVNNVSFQYPNTDRKVLKNITTNIKQGEKIAIVGENGSGKSTFVSLLCGLYTADEGEVLVNGIDISQNLNLLRSCVSCTFQKFGNYELSINENVRIGDLHTAHTDEEVMNALRQSGASDFAGDYEDGIETHLGTHKKGGINLSGGQWQKIAMARNLLKKSARVVILDEPTAALDPLSEVKLYEDFNSLMGDRTVMLISHRLGSTRLADRILVFHEGEIIEEGTHGQLLSLNGMYAKMYAAQSQWYV